MAEGLFRNWVDLWVGSMGCWKVGLKAIESVVTRVHPMVVLMEHLLGSSWVDKLVVMWADV